MKKASKAYLFSFLLLMSSNNTPTLGKGAYLTSALATQLIPGVTTREKIKALLGSPSHVIDLSQSPNSKGKGEVWEYEQAGYVRFSAAFDPSSEVLSSLNFSVQKEDSEQKLREALGKFPGADWAVETTNWINPHAFPDECYFVDAKLGIMIEYRRTRKEVASIFRWNPSRQLAAVDDGPPPKFCIAGKCFDGISAKEWKKNWSPCEIPK